MVSKMTMAKNVLFALLSVIMVSCSTVEKTEKTIMENREGFSVREISDDLFDRMKRGNTYKKDCIVPREELRYLLVLHK
ncbi:MAG: hypothetical protein IJ846_08245, partial [Alphaproteobacteria bacterium]|nr:hypothetical protein [Alphaproteobacteria bacterium]